jgi:vitamin K-dependent gamma-carboxylase
MHSMPEHSDLDGQTHSEPPNRTPESAGEPSETAHDGPAVNTRWIHQLQPFAPTDIAPLAFFRIFFGTAMLYHTCKNVASGFVEYAYIRPLFNFTHPGFSWVTPWPGDGMYVHFAVMAIAAVGILTGCLYRVSATVFAVCHLYVFLLEKVHNNNHDYLICLLSGIIIFVPAHRLWSVDALLKPRLRSDTAPRIWLWLLRFQIAIPYVYGGISKINYDWLHGQPIRIWLGQWTNLPAVGPYMTTDISVMLFAWGGVFFDLLVVPALLWKRTRRLAFAGAIVFHLMNAMLWTIGVFRWLMIGATLLFFPAATIRRVLSRRKVRSVDDASRKKTFTKQQRATLACVGIYVFLQLIIPFRQWLYPGSPSWTEEAQHFSWRMMLRNKQAWIRFYAHDRETGHRGVVDLTKYLNGYQLKDMSKDPDWIVQFVHFLRDNYRKDGAGDLEIRVVCMSSLNGRKPQLLMDPTIDYASVDRVLGPQPWIVPLHEPFRRDAWSTSSQQWDLEFRELIPKELRIR